MPVSPDVRTEDVLEILSKHRDGLTSIQLHRLLAESPAAYRVSEVLDDLRKRGRVRFIKGAIWQLNGEIDALPHQPGSIPTTLASHQADSRWDPFRRLCRFYAECARIEGGTAVVTYADRENKSFIQLPPTWNWQTWAEGSPCFLPLEMLPQQLKVDAAKGDAILFQIAGPLDIAARANAKNQSPVILPVFVARVSVKVQPGSAMLAIRQEGSPEVNTEWLDTAFRTSYENRRAFIEFCQLDVPSGQLDGHVHSPPEIPALVTALSAFSDRARAEPLNPYNLRNDSLQGISRSGLHNRFILTAERASPYTRRLQAELRLLSDPRRIPDKDLDTTALRLLFPHDPPAQATATQPPMALPSVAELETLNLEQTEAAQAAISQPITVVTGPPGTGKSRVVANVMAHAAIHKTSVILASRNHQAIEAVVPLLNKIADARSFVVRLSSPDPEASRRPLIDALRELFAGTTDTATNQATDRKRQTVARRLQDVSETKQAFLDAQSLFSEMDALSQQLEALRKTPHGKFLDTLPDLPSETAIDATRRRLSRVPPLPRSPWLSPPNLFLRWLTLRPFLSEIRATTQRLALALENDAKLPQETTWTFLRKVDEIGGKMENWAATAQVVQQGRKMAQLRKTWEGMPALPAIEELLHQRRQVAQETVKNCLRELARARGYDFESSDEREIMDQLRATITQDARNGGDNRASRLSAKHYQYLTKHLPLWATTTLSVGRHLPLRAGIFDLLIVDEASQCDIASVIPLLFRCRRLLAVGDPQQLRFVSRIKPTEEDRLRLRTGTSNPDPFDRYRYRDRSFYELASTSRALPLRGPIGLREHFRCDPEIAAYFNKQFYREHLIVLTKGNRRDVITGPHGIRWTDCSPDGCGAKGGGSWSPEQVKRIVEELIRLAEAGFNGTVGVVTPFREQARRIADAIEQTGKRNLIPPTWDLRVDTADGFQGGERDLMLFSLVGGPDMPKGSLWFYEEDPNRFNVAVSRARKVLHVFGSKQWVKEWSAGEIGRKHLSALLNADEDTPQSEDPDPVAHRLAHKTPPIMGDPELIGPVWEPQFAQLLWDSGLPVIQQYATCGRFLDVGLVSKNGKLDIEVDGECHRDISGMRKVSDIERDLTLVAQGWRIKRFWVYQLRENMDACADEVRTLWSSMTNGDQHES